MKVAICGISGFIGSSLKEAFEAEGYIVVGISRVDLSSGLEHLRELLRDANALVNIAGAPIAGRWTKARKEEIYNSRIETTRKLVEAMNGMASPPQDFISASAVGIYDEINVHDEFSLNYASGFLARICRDWEREALKVNPTQTRLSIFRLGVVLSGRGGALKKMIMPFKFGFGAKIGSGEAFMPWIHIDDVVKAIVEGVSSPRVSGVYNLVAPEILTNREFTAVLAKSLGRPAIFTLPSKLIRLLFGEGAGLILDGQQVIPQRLLADGFEFTYPTLVLALEKEFGSAKSR